MATRRRSRTGRMAARPAASEPTDTRTEKAALGDLLDRGWALLEDDDMAGLAAVASDLTELVAATERAGTPLSGPDLAEIDALAGVKAALAGDVDSARAAYARASTRDPECAGYYLMRADAELLLADDPAAAVEMCDLALDVASEEEDLVDAVMYKAEALVSLGDRDDEAREVLAELEGCAIGDALLLCRAGDLHLTLGDLRAAERSYRRAVGLDEGCADAYHGLGMIHHARGDMAPMTEAWLKTRALDLRAPAPPWHLSGDEFERVAERSLAELPEEVRDRLANVPIFIEPAPSEDLVRSGIDPRLLGLFDGVPLPHKSHIVDGQQPSLDAIYLFQRNLERFTDSREVLLEEIRITVLHETAHFFGLEDDDLDAMGLG